MSRIHPTLTSGCGDIQPNRCPSGPTLNSKKFFVSDKKYRKIVTGLINSKNNIRSAPKKNVTDVLFTSGMTLAGPRALVSEAKIQAFPFFHGAGTLNITVGCLAQKTCTRVGLHGPHCKKRTVGTSTRADACVCSPPVAVGSRREKIVRNWHTCAR